VKSAAPPVVVTVAPTGPLTTRDDPHLDAADLGEDDEDIRRFRDTVVSAARLLYDGAAPA
jgi:hypothetical protein